MMPKIEATIGPMPDMKAEVISAWFEPSSKLTTVYEIQLRVDGVMSCNCPGWVNQAKKDERTGEKIRSCRHCREHFDEAQSILDGKQPRVFRQDPDLLQKLLAKRGPAGKLGGPRRRMIQTG